MSATAFKLLHGQRGGAIDEQPTLAPKPATPEQHALVTEHLWLISARGRALAFRASHPLWEDAYQDAAVALLRAATRFDAARGVPFEHYARPWVDNSLKATLCQLGPVRIPVGEVMARIARGERATATALPYLESAADSERVAVGLARAIAQRTQAAAELEAADCVDIRRAIEWLNARLEELPRRQADAMRLAAEVGTVACAAQLAVGRHSVKRWRTAGMQFLRDEAAADELQI